MSLRRASTMTPSDAAAESDERLVGRARRGCAASFEELMRRHEVRVLHFLRHRGGDGEAEDLLQETFIRAYRNLHRYRSRWRFTTWLYTIARRVSINHARRPRLETTPAAASPACPAPGPAEVAARRDEHRRLWSIAAEVLRRGQLEVLWLHYVEGMPLGEVAAVLGRSRVAVKTMLFRARQTLLPYFRARFEETSHV